MGIVNDCNRVAETQRELLDGGAWLLRGQAVNDKAAWIFPSTAAIVCLNSVHSHAWSRFRAGQQCVGLQFRYNNPGRMIIHKGNAHYSARKM